MFFKSGLVACLLLSSVSFVGCAKKKKGTAPSPVEVESPKQGPLEFAEGPVTIKLRKLAPVSERLQEQDEGATRSITEQVNRYKVLIAFPKSYEGVARLRAAVGHGTATASEEANLEYAEDEASEQTLIATAVVDLNSPQNSKEFGPFRVRLMIDFKNGVSVNHEFTDLLRDLFIPRRTEGLGAPDVLLGDLVNLKDDVVIAIDRLIMEQGSKLVTDGRIIDIRAKEVIVLGSAEVTTFPTTIFPEFLGGKGRSGGEIRLRADKASGNLHFIMRGERGQMGRVGTPGLAGAKGEDGFSGDVGGTCSDPHRRPRDGGVGRSGGPGGDGGKGGDSGAVHIRIQDGEAFRVKVTSVAGEGGHGGFGGPGGPGGSPGNPGRGRDCVSLARFGGPEIGRPACTERVCNMILNADGTSRAPKVGEPGPQGRAGQAGSPGTVEESCLQLSSEEEIRCRK